MPLDITAIRRQFSFLQHDPKSVYLDSAATTQKPEAVIDAMCRTMEQPVGNVHRGQHYQTEVATDAYEAARKIVATFIGAAYADEIMFTKNCTESINLVAHAWARNNLREGDHIALSILEHHSNIVPWLQLQQEKNIVIDWIDIDDNGHLRMDELEKILKNGNVKLVAITGQSNVLGIQTPLENIIQLSHTYGAKVLVDAAQLVAHAQVDVTKMHCDFLAFSGHKIYGPTGIGVLYVRREIAREMTPFLGGGGMVHMVTQDTFTPANAPACFEAGTPPITEAIGLATAIEWQQQFSWADRMKHDEHLMQTAIEELLKISGLHILPERINPFDKLRAGCKTNECINPSGCISFTIDGVHPHDLTDLLGQQGFALRAGHQCTQPLHTRLGISASTRISFGLYTTEEEIKECVQAIKEIQKRFV